MEEEEGKTGGVRSRFVAPGAKLGQAARRDSAAAPPPPPPLPDAPTPQNPLYETSINVDFERNKNIYIGLCANEKIIDLCDKENQHQNDQINPIRKSKANWPSSKTSPPPLPAHQHERPGNHRIGKHNCYIWRDSCVARLQITRLLQETEINGREEEDRK